MNVLAIVADDCEVFALVTSRDDIEDALRAVFWRREIEYRHDDPTDERGGWTTWAGIDIAEHHWTVWCYPDPPDADGGHRLRWQQGIIDVVEVWAPLPEPSR